MKPKVYMLFGATGSGKTARALDFARTEAAAGRVVEIINADSRQIYKGLPTLAACPTAADYAVCPHHLFEFFELNQRYSAGMYAADARRVVDEVLRRGNVPLLVGGTGFYLKAFEGGLGTDEGGMMGGPQVDIGTLVDKYGDMSVDELGAKVRTLDPVWWERANVSERRNPQRMMRVIGVAETTGKRLTAWQREGDASVDLPYEVERWVQERPLPELKERLRVRVEEGAKAIVAEVQAVLAAGVAADAPGLQALGFEVWAEAVRGARTVKSAIDETVKLHLGYAKRQRTWGKQLAT